MFADGKRLHLWTGKQGCGCMGKRRWVLLLCAICALLIVAVWLASSPKPAVKLTWGQPPWNPAFAESLFEEGKTLDRAVTERLLELQKESAGSTKNKPEK